MKLSDVGERTLVELARKICKRGARVRVGIGDDAAALDLDSRNCAVVTTDMLVASRHFPPGTSPEQMGRRAVVVNLSDLAAMGAKPLGLIFSVGLPKRLKVKFVERLVRGMDVAAREHGTYVIGGDLSESKEVVISGAAFGIARKRELLTRSGAKVGDLIAVTGRLGAAAAGLKLLLKRLPVKSYRALVRAQLEPRARVREGRALARSGFVTSAIDVTDGLAANLWQLAKESKVKIVIDRDSVPEHPLVRKFAVEHGFNVDNLVLLGGEDFELLFTVRPRGWEKVRLALKRMGTTATMIGCVARGKGVFIQAKGKTRALPDRGYEHFR
ncbi:Thiamine-monophosphate kinase [subsurface metagenome]|nr:thiamine-phosphate kinase [Hadesarchaea archaeon]